MKNMLITFLSLSLSLVLVGCGGVVKHYVLVPHDTPYVVNDYVVTEEIIPQGMKYCELGRDPVDRTRRLQQGEKFVLLGQDTVVTMTTGSGKEVTCALRAGTSVAVSTETGKVVWIQVCGNTVLNDVYVPVPRRRPPSIRAVIIERPAPTYSWGGGNPSYYNGWGGGDYYRGRSWGGGHSGGATTGGGVTINNYNRHW